MEHNPEGAPVLVSIEDLGPFYGRAFIDEIGDFEVFELAEQTGWLRSWRVEIPQVPYRLVGQLRTVVDRMGAPLSVRLWGAIEQLHYSGKAYGLFNVFQPHQGDPRFGMTLHGQGRIKRGLLDPL